MNPRLRASAAHVFVADLGAPSLDATDAHHLQRVLRVRERDVVTVSDGAGAWCEARLVGDRLDLVSEVRREMAPRACSIVTAIPKGDRPEWIVQKLTEVGATEIVFADFERSVVRWDASRAARNRARLQRVMREAAMQARRVWLPTVTIAGRFPGELLDVPCALAEPDGTDEIRVNRLVIGPEGGFSPTELALDLPRVSLGATILRTETATVVGALRVLFSSETSDQRPRR